MIDSRKVIFISSALQQPRHQKRINLLREFFDLEIFYFAREKYVKNLKGYDKGARLIGKVKDGKYFGRILLLMRLWLILMQSDAKKIYCTAPDQAFVAILAAKEVVLELGDLYQLDGKGRLFAWVDFIFAKYLKALVLTSPFFWTGYYSRYDALRSKVIFVENRLPISIKQAVSDYRCTATRGARLPVRIGIIGNFTNIRPLQLIRDVVLSRADLELHVFGEGRVDVFEGADRCFYHGAFRSPEDLSKIYSEIDINYVVYDYASNNVKFALPNKLYESAAFLKPLICVAGVALEESVLSHGLGAAVELNMDSVSKAIDYIVENYGVIQEKMMALPESFFLDYDCEKIKFVI